MTAIRAAALATTLAAAIITAAPAHADLDVAGYLAALARDHVGSADTGASVQTGLKLCTMLRQGRSINDVVSIYSRKADVPYSFLLTVTTDANRYLCPDATPAAIAP